MKIGYLIHIDTGRTDVTNDTSLGFSNGLYKWSTVDISGYATILDHTNFGEISNDNNSIYGGTYSTHNDFTLTVCNPMLVSHIANNALRFVGCKVSAWMSKDNAAINLFTDMIISDFAPVDELTINLTMKDSVGLDGISTLKTAITSALIPSIDQSKTNDSLTTTIGNPAWIKLVPCTTSAPVVSTINSKGDRLDLESNASFARLGDGTPNFPSSFFVKSVNIRDGFPTELQLGSSVFDNMPQVYAGLSLEIISGTGKGDVYTISAVYTKTASGVDPTHWVVLDREIKDGDIIAYGDDTRQTAANKTFARGLGYHPVMSHVVNVKACEHPRITTMSKTDDTEAESFNDSASRFRLANSHALFAAMVDKDTTLTTDCKGITDVGLIDVDVNSVGVVLTDEQYRLITLSYGKNVKQDNDKVKVSALKYVPARWDNKSMGELTSCAVVWVPGAWHHDFYHQTCTSTISAIDGDALTQNIFREVTSATCSPYTGPVTDPTNYTGTAHMSAMHCAYYHRIDTPQIDGMYLGDDEISEVIPAIALNLSISTPSDEIPNSQFDFRVYIRALIVDDNNVVSEIASYGSDDGDEDLVIPPCWFDVAMWKYGIQSGCDINGTGDENILKLMTRLKSALAIGDKIKGMGKNAKYLYVQTCVSTNFVNPELMTLTAKMGVRNKGLIYTLDVDKEKLYIKSSNGQTPITNPIALLRALCDKFAVAYDSNSFNSAETQLIYSIGSLTDNPNIIIDDDSIEDLIAKICRYTNVSVYSDGGRLFAKWWIADRIENRTPALSFGNADITRGGYSISRDNGGYISTSYKFGITNLFGTKSTLTVDAGNVDAFPTENLWSTSGDPMTDTIIFGTFDEVDKTSNYVEFTVTPPNKNLNALAWIPNYYYGITATDKTSGVTSVGIYKLISVSGYLQAGIKCLAECITGTLFTEWQSMTHSFSATPWRSMRDWQYLVSGGVISSNDYTTAYNMWEAVKGAKDLLGKANAMDTRYTTIDIPCYTNSNSWLKSILYTIKHNTFARSIIRLNVPVTKLNQSMSNYLMNYITVNVGPYAGHPTTGWIIGYSLSPSSDIVNFTVMTANSDENILIYDENGLSNQIVIDETGITNDSINELYIN